MSNLRDRLMAQRVENWLGQMCRNPNFQRTPGDKSLLEAVADVVNDNLTAKDFESMIAAAAGGDAEQLLEIFDRHMRPVVERFAEAYHVDVVAEYRAELAEYAVDSEREAA